MTIILSTNKGIFLLLCLLLLACKSLQDLLNCYTPLCTRRRGFYHPHTRQFSLPVAGFEAGTNCYIVHEFSLRLCGVYSEIFRFHGNYTNSVRLSVILPSTNFDIEYTIVQTYQPVLELLWPPNGALMVDDFHIKLGKINAFKSPVDIEIIGLKKFSLDADQNYMESRSGIEPATWFVNAMHNQQTLPTRLFLDFVLRKDDIIKERVFSSRIDKESTLYQIPKYTASSSKINVCVWASDVLDGQKTIWINQIKYLDPNRFHFHWIMSSGMSEDREKLFTVLTILKTLTNVEVVASPLLNYVIQPEELGQLPDDGDVPFAGNEDKFSGDAYHYITYRANQARFDIDKISPRWVKRIFEVTLSVIKNRCDLISFGNNRNSSTDLIISDSARILGIPSVTELLNLFGSDKVVTDVIIAPSLYAIKHYSMQTMRDVNLPSYRRMLPLDNPLSLVISPGADTQRFTRNSYENSFDRFRVIPNCIVVGFLARLAPEKNPGLIITLAHALLQRRQDIRFVIIGDGDLKQPLSQLAQELQVSNFIDFVGWISDDLPRVLSGIDIVVNPSLRGWSETFCIANIEAMSMEIPIVTFAVGGVGEYVEAPIKVNNTLGFQITPNAVIVNEAHPEHIADAIDVLCNDKELRRNIGREARKTIEKGFTIEQQMNKYTDLYTYLYEHTILRYGNGNGRQ